MTIPLFKVLMDDDAVEKRVNEVLRSGFVGQGPVVEELETLLRHEWKIRYPLTVNSATSGLHLALHLAKSKFAGEDIEVLTTPLTCTATNWPILANGLKLRWIDIDPNTLNIDIDDLVSKLNEKTKIIMVVHWGGYPIDLVYLDIVLNRFEFQYGFRPIIIEDCAHAMGAKLFDIPIQNYPNNINVFSLQAIKHWTSVDGGIVVFKDRDFYRRAKLLRWYGIDRDGERKDFRCEDDIPEWGYKFHMNDLNAAIAIANKTKSELFIQKNIANAQYYRNALNNIDGIQLLTEAPGFNSSYWLFTILVDNRDEFMAKMNAHGITTSRVHERNDKHSCVADFKSELPNLESVVDRMVCIPVGWWLQDSERQYIVDKIEEGW